MPSTDAFALTRSGLNPFLFADIGVELNGSTLTVLSMLGRLGQDPWAEAGRWAGMPKIASISALVDSIRQMPLSAEALLDARVTATRLVGLLPTASQPSSQDTPHVPGAKAMPRWLPAVIIYCALAGSIVANLCLSGVPRSPAAPRAIATYQSAPAAARPAMPGSP